MPNYRRPATSARPVFLTGCLADRRSSALLDYLELLREAVRLAKVDRLFEILAWVVLPDHMHAVWRLPQEDPNYLQRWGRIKARFFREARRAGLAAPCDGAAFGGTSPALRSGPGEIRRAGFAPPGETPRKGESGIWQRRFWEHHCRDDRYLEAHIRYFWLNPVKHGLVERPADWAASSIHRDI